LSRSSGCDARRTLTIGAAADARCIDTERECGTWDSISARALPSPDRAAVPAAFGWLRQPPSLRHALGAGRAPVPQGFTSGGMVSLDPPADRPAGARTILSCALLLLAWGTSTHRPGQRAQELVRVRRCRAAPGCSEPLWKSTPSPRSNPQTCGWALRQIEAMLSPVLTLTAGVFWRASRTPARPNWTGVMLRGPSVAVAPGSRPTGSYWRFSRWWTGCFNSP
jgi:hypothetical protein